MPVSNAKSLPNCLCSYVLTSLFKHCTLCSSLLVLHTSAFVTFNKIVSTVVKKIIIIILKKIDEFQSVVPP